MKFINTIIEGAYLIELDCKKDSRGIFARTFCASTFKQHGLLDKFLQHSVCVNNKKDILRGLHYQKFPYEEAKLIRCSHGKIFDVIVDLRTDSSSYGKHYTVVLSEQEHTMLYVPHGCAHGYVTLTAKTEVIYCMTEVYHPECTMGIYWQSEDLNIDWPTKFPILSEQDQKWQPFKLIQCQENE